jgi:hypothetical protein
MDEEEYVVLVPSIQVRESVALDSAKVRTKYKGEKLVVVERQILPGENGVLVRLRLKEGGWTSLTYSKDHTKKLVQKLDAASESKAPPPAPDSSADGKGSGAIAAASSEELPGPSDAVPSALPPPASASVSSEVTIASSLSLDECTSNQAAVDLLMGSMWLADHNLWFTARKSDGATFRRLVLDECVQTTPPSQTPGASLFSSHLKLALPDNPPRKDGPRASAVHKFVVREDIAKNILFRVLAERGKTHEEEMKKAAEGGNKAEEEDVGGGFHSPEENLANDYGSKWCQVLKAVISEALVTLNGDAEPTPWLLSGWLNAFDAENFTALHNSDTEWSFVYFVLPGDASSNTAALSSDSGCLLLRTQVEAFTQHYGYLSVKPTPGELWAFHGHVFRASMPGKPFGSDGVGAVTQGIAAANLNQDDRRIQAAASVVTKGQRITIACNAIRNDFAGREFLEEQRMKMKQTK